MRPALLLFVQPVSNYAKTRRAELLALSQGFGRFWVERGVQMWDIFDANAGFLRENGGKLTV